MDYEQLTTRQLQDECKQRGLPSGRVKAELIERLTEYDAIHADAVDDFAAFEEDPPPSVEPETSSAPEQPRPMGEPLVAEPPSVPGVHQCRFPAKSEGPSEQEHADYRAQTAAAAAGLGLAVRGDAYRTGTVDGFEVYEVRVRGWS